DHRVVGHAAAADLARRRASDDVRARIRGLDLAERPGLRAVARRAEDENQRVLAVEIGELRLRPALAVRVGQRLRMHEETYRRVRRPRLMDRRSARLRAGRTFLRRCATGTSIPLRRRAFGARRCDGPQSYGTNAAIDNPIQRTTARTSFIIVPASLPAAAPPAGLRLFSSVMWGCDSSPTIAPSAAPTKPPGIAPMP